MLILADPDPPATDGQAALLLTIASLVGGALQYLAGKALEWWHERRGERARGEASVVGHLQSLVTRLDVEKAALSREKEVAEDERRSEAEKKSRCKISAFGMRRHIRYLESTLARERVVFVPYEEDADGDGSDVHEPLKVPAPVPTPPPTEDSPP